MIERSLEPTRARSFSQDCRGSIWSRTRRITGTLFPRPLPRWKPQSLKCSNETQLLWQQPLIGWRIEASGSPHRGQQQKQQPCCGSRINTSVVRLSTCGRSETSEEPRNKSQTKFAKKRGKKPRGHG